MSIWTRITNAISSLAQGEGLSAILDHLKTPPERNIGFTIAIIGLGAKMAKADGEVTRDEVIAFRQIFQISDSDEAGAARVFNLARQDVAGYETYADKIAKLFKDDREMLIDLLEGLFHIAMADGNYHPAEDAFLGKVAAIFGLDERVFMCLRSRYVPGATPDPYSVLGITPDMSFESQRKQWRILVRQVHPDAMIARGLPKEAISIATNRLANINTAWEQIIARQKSEPV